MRPLAPLRLAPLLTAVSLLALSGCKRTGGDPPADGSNASGEVIEYEGTTLEGRPWSLADRRGEVTLVNVWGLWCAPCIKEMPLLSRVHREWEGTGAIVVAVSVDPMRRADELRAFAEDHALPFPVLHDHHSRIATTLGVQGYPTTVLIGRDGREVARSEGLLREDDGPLLTEARSKIAEGVAERVAEETAKKPAHDASGRAP